MKEKPKVEALERAYVNEPWRCTGCGIFVYSIDFIDGDFYPVAGAPPPKYISTVYNKVCCLCYDMFHSLLSRDYWKNVQDTENSKIRKLRPGNDYLGV